MRLASTPVALVALSSRSAQLGVALVECLREPRHPSHGDLQSGGVSAKVCDSVASESRQLVGVQPADRGGQVAQGVGQLVGRRRAVERNGSRQLAVTARV